MVGIADLGFQRDYIWKGQSPKQLGTPTGRSI